MGPGDRAPATVILVTHDSGRHIGRALDALTDDPAGPAEIIVVDNASGDDTAAIVGGRPVRWVPLDRNTGFAGGCHAGVARAAHDTVVFLNPDAVPARGWLPPMLAALDDPGVGATMATVELAGEPGHFNTSGGSLTYYGLAWVSDYGAPIPDETAPIEVAFPSGTAMAMRKAAWAATGGFLTHLFLYHEDTDLGWRLRLRGLRSVRVPGARVTHDYSFDRNRDKLFYLERNRLVLLASNYRGPTLALLAPALAVVEIGVVAVAARDGWLGAKLASWRGFLALRCEWREARRAVAQSRVVGDAAILETMQTALSTMRVPTVRLPRGLGLVDVFLTGYLRLVLPAVRWFDRRAGY